MINRKTLHHFSLLLNIFFQKKFDLLNLFTIELNNNYRFKIVFSFIHIILLLLCWLFFETKIIFMNLSIYFNENNWGIYNIISLIIQTIVLCLKIEMKLKTRYISIWKNSVFYLSMPIVFMLLKSMMILLFIYLTIRFNKLYQLKKN